MSDKRVARLEAIADEIDAAVAHVDDLYAERLKLWQRCRKSGSTVRELADASRLMPVTVRTLLDRAGK